MVILEGQKDIYVPVKLLSGSGGQAGVYLCENQTGAQFTVKIYQDMNGICNQIHRFLYQTESDYLMKMQDHGVSEINGKKCAFEIFEYFKRGPLSNEAPLSEQDMEMVVIPCINEALHEMHQAGYLHRDVKPNNMYRELAPGINRVKLGDFGISVYVGDQANYCDAALAFSPGYVPAEVLGTGMYSTASDYYGFAVSIYYLLTGKQIFDGLTPDEIMIKTRRGEMMEYTNISKRMAELLEGLTVQDPRYRWGYREVKAWLAGASVPVFRYSQEEQVLNPPYQLTAVTSCSSLLQLHQALIQNPQEGKEHLYEGLLADALRKQYQHLSNSLTDITVNRFPHARNAGLAMAVKLLNPSFEFFYWNGKIYEGLFSLLREVQEEAMTGILSPASEELLTSGILSYYYSNIFSDEDLSLLKIIEQDAKTNVVRSACNLTLRLLPDPLYQPRKEISVYDVDGYVAFLEEKCDDVAEQVYKDFNREYFVCWLARLGNGTSFREWKEHFYRNGSIEKNEQLIGNVCLYLERICSKKQTALRAFLIAELKNKPEFWLKNHLDLYETDEMMELMNRENFFQVKYSTEMSVQELLWAEQEMKESMYELRREFLNNPKLYEYGVYDVTDYRIFSKDPDAYFVSDRNYGMVPAGWLKEMDGLQNKRLVEMGADTLNKEAKTALEQFGKKVRGWSAECSAACQERKKKRQVPGLVGGMATLLGSILLLVFLGLLSRGYLQGSGIITKAGFVLSFLTIVVCLAAGISRLNQFRLWKRLVHSVDNLNDIAKNVDELQEKLQTDAWKPGEEVVPATHNLQMEAQAERAYSGYLSLYRCVKNKLLPYFVLFVFSFCILGAGVYQDGNISLNGNIISQIGSLLQTGKSNVSSANKDETKYVVSVSKARLRAGAGTSYAILNAYDRGTEITIDGKTQSDGSYIWYHVTAADGAVGWMREDTISRQE